MLPQRSCVNLLYCLCFLFSLFSIVNCEKVLYSFRNRAIEVTSVKNVPLYASAYGVFDNKINETGWAYLEIHTSKNYTDVVQSYAAGFLEAHLTYDLIWMHWTNTMKDFCDGQTEVCQKIDNYIERNLNWLTKMTDEKANSSSYWYHVKLYLQQLQGLIDGYNNANPFPERKLSALNILYMNMDGDLEDLVPAIKGVSRRFSDSHCSALIKVLPDLSNILVSHVTWTSYQSMLRIQKKYVLNIKTLPNTSKIIKGHTMSFSSYPGILASGDDFYVISSRLVALETTIGNSNPAIWHYISPEGQVMEFIRVMVSNRLAGTGRTWVDMFKQFNSGTYNNQWMILDYKKFAPGSAQGLKDELLWVVEQIPGMTEIEDATHTLRSQGYWPSYNIAYFPMIFNASGGPDSVKKHGDWFSYNKHPRALIFKRDQGKIKDMNGMIEMMTYNDFKHDPLSKCDCDPPYSAENAISARNDLNLKNGTYPFPSLGHRSHGATDVKITCKTMSKDFRFVGISGPAHNESRGIPPFRWSDVDFGSTTPHLGHPNEWTFKPVTHKWLDD